MVSLALWSLSEAVPMRGFRNQQNYQQYEFEMYQPPNSNPIANIIGSIARPLHALADRLTRRPDPPGLPDYFGPPGPFDHQEPDERQDHHGHHGHHGHHNHNHNHGYPGPQQNPFHQMPQSHQELNPFLHGRPDEQQFNNYPQQPNPQGQFYDFSQGQQYPKPGFSNNPWAGSNNGQQNNGFGPPQPSFGNRPQQRPQFGGNSGFVNNNGFGGNGHNNQQQPGGLPQGNNGFAMPASQGSQNGGLVESTFGGFGNNGGTQPQEGSQDGGLVESTFGGFGGNGGAQPQQGSQDGGLIESTFGGFGDNGGNQPQQGSQNGGLIESTFGGFPPSNPAENPTNIDDGLVGGVFGVPAPNNQVTNTGNNVNSAQPNQSAGNGLVESVFGGLDTLPNQGNTVQSQAPTGITDTEPDNQLIESVFNGFNNDNDQNNIGTSTALPSTTNSNGLIYDIDIRSS